VAKQRPKGWAIESGTGEPIVAAQAAMLAVHWAMTSEVPRSRRVQGLSQVHDPTFSHAIAAETTWGDDV
jgi:hypothetical protein